MTNCTHVRHVIKKILSVFSVATEFGVNVDACSQDASRKAVVNNVVATRAKFALVATECHGHLVSRSPRLTFMNHVADVIGCRFSLKLL